MWQEAIRCLGQAVTMDLTPFAGHTIDLDFCTWQDGAFTLQMMYVDDISIPEPAVASPIKFTSVITMRLNRDAETSSIPLPV